MKKLGLLVAAALLSAAPLSFYLSQQGHVGLALDRAKAEIGKPLSAGSVAGTHRRHERREEHKTPPPASSTTPPASSTK